MDKLLSISKDSKIKVNSKISEFMFPNQIYLPIDSSCELLIRKKTILKDDALFQYHNKTQYSPVSGKILKIIKRKNYLEEEGTYLLIENDFQENDHYQGDNTTVLLTNDILKKLQENKEVDLSIFQGKKHIFLCGIEDEPYLANVTFLHKFHVEEILLMLDSISSYYNISSITICLKETDRESIESFERILNTYQNIEILILPDFYPLKNPLFLKKYLKLSQLDVVVTSEEIFDYYYAVVKLRKKDFLYITLTGDAINNPQVVKVKVGTLLTDVVRELVTFNKDQYDILINGLLTGTPSILENIILTEDIRAVYFMRKKNNRTNPCNHCGKCTQVCPMNCNPYKSVLTKGKKKSTACISCGLCNFICPSNIEISKYTKGETHEL